MLNRTNGFKGLMRLLRPAYLRLTEPGGMPDTEAFAGIFEKIPLQGRGLQYRQLQTGNERGVHPVQDFAWPYGSRLTIEGIRSPVVVQLEFHCERSAIRHRETS